MADKQPDYLLLKILKGKILIASQKASSQL